MSEQTMGERIRLARKDAGARQIDIADAMCTAGFTWSQAAVWGIESNSRKLTLSEAVELSRILRLSLNEIAGIEAPGVLALRKRVLQLESLMGEIGRLARVGDPNA